MNNIKKIFLGIAVIILVLPTFIRLNKPLPGIENYYFINQFAYFPDYVFRILPLFFGFLSLIMFYLLLKQLKFRKNLSYISTLLFLVSTPFIYISNYFTPHFLFLFINLTAFYLFLRKEKHLYLLSIPLFLSTAMFGIYSFVTILALITYMVTFKKHQGLLFTLVIAILIFTLTSLPGQWFAQDQHYLQMLISDFGGNIGIGISALILALFGFMKTWKQKYKYLFVYFAIALLFVACKYLFFAIIYLNIPIVIFASIALNELLYKKWELKFIKQIAVIALVCTFLFSAVSFVNRSANEQPSDSIVKSLVFLRNQKQGIVFSHPSKGFWINYYSHKPVLMDKLDKDPELENLTTDLYYSRSFKNSTKILDEHKIRYIWIDEKMKNGQVWTKPEQGLLFLFVDERLFTQIYKKNGIEIWEYHPEQQQTI